MSVKTVYHQKRKTAKETGGIEKWQGINEKKRVSKMSKRGKGKDRHQQGPTSVVATFPVPMAQMGS